MNFHHSKRRRYHQTIFGAICLLALACSGEAVKDVIAQDTIQLPTGSNLADAIKKAKAEGKSELVTPRAGYTAHVAPGLDEALAHSHVVVATVVSSTTTVDSIGVGLVTWDKLRVLQTIHDLSAMQSGKKPKSGIPKTLQSLDPRDIVLSHLGGTAIIQGIKVTTPSLQESLQKGKTYVLFLTPHPSENSFFLMLGSDAVYRVAGDLLVPARPSKSNLIAADISSKIGNSLTEFKRYHATTQR